MHGAERTRVAWRPWGRDAFAAASRAETPVVLSLVAPWCRWCRRLDEAVYDDPELAADVEAEFVPVRVDADRAPMVRERYAMGGFPTTAFLTPTGDVLAGGAVLDADGFRELRDRARSAWAARGEDAGRVPRAVLESGERPGDATDVEARVAAEVAARYDADHGGWGSGVKFPFPRAVEFALLREPDAARGTLAAVRRSLRDDDGGFFRYAAGRDWTEPRREKLLDTNAALCRAFANAYLVTGEATYRETAAEAVDYLASTLWTGTAFGGSQAPPDPDEDGAPPVDETVFANRNAVAADALLVHHAHTDSAAARRYAERTLEYLATTLVTDGVVAHYDEEGAPRGLLADQAHVAGAFARAAQVLGPRYLECATAVADAVLDVRDGATGAVPDGPLADVPVVDRPLCPVDANAHLANALVDLHALTGRDRYLDTAREVVAAFAGARERLGPQAAAYATAAARVTRRPLRILVATASGSALHRAALRTADTEKVVVPDAGDALRQDLDVERGAAYVVAGAEPSRAARTPDELLARVAEVA